RFAVEEMCLIDPAGSEISRIVGDRIAHDLSQDEARASFFSPGFDTPRRNVYVSPAYISADVDKWVVAYVTPVVVADKKRAILHYEHGLDIYQKLLNRDLEGTASYVLAVDADGYVVSDSRRVMSVARRADGDGRSAYFETFSFAGLDLASFRQQVDAGAALTNVTGGPVDAAYSVVEDWTLIAVIDTSQAMAAQ
ncbi:MAG: hypothetical protein KDE45_15965, partial [Caldilineaceae bacterium]|nr:hypothetical protein [Caldilineaceae bacterium]